MERWDARLITEEELKNRKAKKFSTIPALSVHTASGRTHRLSELQNINLFQLVKHIISGGGTNIFGSAPFRFIKMLGKSHYMKDIRFADGGIEISWRKFFLLVKDQSEVLYVNDGGGLVDDLGKAKNGIKSANDCYRKVNDNSKNLYENIALNWVLDDSRNSKRGFGLEALDSSRHEFAGQRESFAILKRSRKSWQVVGEDDTNSDAIDSSEKENKSTAKNVKNAAGYSAIQTKNSKFSMCSEVTRSFVLASVANRTSDLRFEIGERMRKSGNKNIAQSNSYPPNIHNFNNGWVGLVLSGKNMLHEQAHYFQENYNGSHVLMNEADSISRKSNTVTNFAEKVETFIDNFVTSLPWLETLFTFSGVLRWAIVET